MENPIKMDDLGGKPTIYGNTQIPPDEQSTKLRVSSSFRSKMHNCVHGPDREREQAQVHHLEAPKTHPKKATSLAECLYIYIYYRYTPQKLTNG